MSHYNVKPLQLVLKPSRRLLLALLGASLLGCLIVACMPLAWWLRLAGVAVIAIAAAYSAARDACLSLPWSWRALDIDASGNVSATSKNGAQVSVRILPSSFVASYLTVLHLQLPASRWTRYCVILPDTVDAEPWRKLRVWLRWGMPTDEQESDLNSDS